MRRHQALIFGIFLGVTSMYLLDPSRGRRRRRRMRDQVTRGVHEIEEVGTSLSSKARHFRNRARGAIIEARARHPHEIIDDEILERRVRAHMSRFVRHPETNHISAEHGRISLRGIEPAEGSDHLVSHVEGIHGVHDVINRLKGRQAAP